ncbi:hypothetical protein FNW02_35935 [Komarekiella sp. 'clone 1']|uniref:Uncharacterized protein n=1 Tax=Komarekiella delphini-convector SJRDD-AB1 TaxID=2593771 RepID=A0AA40VVC3_9NOST|nr:hypothetical protein [Komarekiella delphini-convector]MBD6620977.1 hypothetical protein [Komarekiella delphini-convector SJRDD-AB1]
MDGQDNLSNYWWERVKSYARIVIEKVECGVESVKEFLSTFTSDECWGAMIEFEEIEPEKFNQMIAIAPDWVEWMG